MQFLYLYFYTYIKDNAKVLITANEATIGDKAIPLKRRVDEALKDRTTSIEHVLVAKRTGRNVPMSNRDISLKEVRHDAVYILHSMYSLILV